MLTTITNKQGKDSQVVKKQFEVIRTAMTVSSRLLVWFHDPKSALSIFIPREGLSYLIKRIKYASFAPC
jgi:hypothetical protein